MEKALSGLRVLEVAHAWAGPLTGMCLADMGAEVIKIERPEVGDIQRSPGVHATYYLLKCPNNWDTCDLKLTIYDKA